MKQKLWKLSGLSVLAVGIVLYIVPLFFPLPEELEKGAPEGLVLLDEEGATIRRLLDGDLRAEAPAIFAEFPGTLIHATLAAEDSRFYQHNGIDYLGTLRAIRDALIHRRFTSGASTITQQTIKLYSKPRKRTFRTKLIETMTARKLEMFATKEAILTAYLNRLPYGNQFTGARAAARGYFGKPISDLSTAEAALLAGIPNKPTRLNPFRNRNGAIQRQRWILMRMAEENYINETTYEASRNEPLRFRKGASGFFAAPHFTELVLQQRPAIRDPAASGDKTIETTLSLSLQQFVEQAATTELAKLAEKTGVSDDLQAAVVVIENETGNIRALTGSRSFFGSQSGQINGAWKPRSAGSTLKPFTYLIGFEQGFTAASILADTPIEYITSTGAYQPVNFDRRFTGPVSVRHALARSLNVPAVKLLNELGGADVLHRRLTNELEFSSLDKDPNRYGLGLTLGNAEVRLLELTNGYATIARLGQHLPWRYLKSDPAEEPVSVFDRDGCWLIADILSDNQARAQAFGLHSPLNLPFPAAAKTGTSTDFRDNWTIGFTPDHTVGVWVGRFNNQPLDRISGATGAAHVYKRVMMELYKDREPAWYQGPPGVEKKTVDRISGKLVTNEIEVPASRTRKEWFINGVLPSVAETDDYTKTGLNRLSSNYSAWWKHTQSPIKKLTAVGTEENNLPTQEQTLTIISPLEGTVALLDPDLPGSGNRFPLKVSGSKPSSIEWSSSTLTIREENGKSWAILSPGVHEIEARDPENNLVATTRFEIRAL